MTPFPFSEYIVAAIFWLFAAFAVAGAAIAALSTRVIRSVSGLALCCVGLAGLYYFLNSPFLALMEILIYVGAVCVTIIFGVMLSEPDEPARQGSERREALWGAVAGAVCAAVFVGIAQLGLRGVWPVHAPAGDELWSVERIGVQLLTTYSFAFEVISLVLLVAILGALAIAHGGRRKE